MTNKARWASLGNFPLPTVFSCERNNRRRDRWLDLSSWYWSYLFIAFFFCPSLSALYLIYCTSMLSQHPNCILMIECACYCPSPPKCKYEWNQCNELAADRKACMKLWGWIWGQWITVTDKSECWWTLIANTANLKKKMLKPKQQGQQCHCTKSYNSLGEKMSSIFL